MKVWVGIAGYHEDDELIENVEHVFYSEKKAKKWVSEMPEDDEEDDIPEPERDYRCYIEKEVE